MKRYLRRRAVRMSVLATVAALLAFGAYAFMASNTVPATNAGDGSGTISGYTISNVAYQLDSNPRNFSGVSFDIAPTTAGTVKITLDGGTTWTACTNSSGSVSCTLGTPSSVLAATNLEVVATD